MRRFGNFIVKRRVLLIIIFALLMIPSLIGTIMTKNNYDILSYMPGDLNSRQGENILQKEFDISGIGLIAVSDKEPWEIEKLKADVEGVEGVKRVIWLDDYTDIDMPVEFTDPQINERFYSGEYTILQVQFDENSRTKLTGNAVKEIRKVIGTKTLFGGEPVIIEDLQAITEKEKLIYMLIAGVSIYLILALSMTSFIEPLLFLVSVGVAIALNMGTNILKGQISFVTSSIAAVMQLGISMDYSIFLLHRFEEEKKLIPDVEEAMASAISKTSVAILASALTTIAGFIALMFMKNGIGRDLGFVLGKGIVLSLVVTITLLPCLILVFHKFCDRFRHKAILPTFKKSSSWIVKWRWVFLILIIVLSVPSFLAQRNLEYYYTNEHYLPETSRSVSDTKEINRMFGAAEIVYMIIPDRGRVLEKELMEEIKTLEVTDSILGISEQVDEAIPESFIPEDVKKEFITKNYRYFSVFLKTSADDKRTFQALDKMKEFASKYYDEYYLAGSAPLAKDLASLVDTDTKTVAIVSIGLIAVILALSFMSISMPVILILVIELAIWINLSIPYFQGTPVSSITSIVIGAIQLGATVDYAILFASRYKENRAFVDNKFEAMKQTIADTGRSILTSALTMLSATIGIAYLTTIKTTGELTMLIGRGAIISMFVIIFGLPSILLALDKLISKTYITRPSRKIERREIK